MAANNNLDTQTILVLARNGARASVDLESTQESLNEQIKINERLKKELTELEIECDKLGTAERYYRKMIEALVKSEDHVCFSRGEAARIMVDSLNDKLPWEYDPVEDMHDGFTHLLYRPSVMADNEANERARKKEADNA